MPEPMEEIFECQAYLQKLTFGHHPADQEDRELVDYIKSMVLEATDELHEILGEMQSWKAHHRATIPPSLNRDQVAREARDVLQYVVNIMLACDWDPQKLLEEYMRKFEVNIARARGETSHKCPTCRRATDDPGALESCKETDCPERNPNA
jgi:hypothetical protein